MFIFLLPLSILLVALLLQYDQEIFQIKGQTGSIRRSFLSSLLVNSFIIFVFNELFSTFNGVTVLNARLFWIGIVALEFILLYRLYKQGRYQKGNIVQSFSKSWQNISSSDRLVIYAVFIVYILPLLSLCLVVPPNNFDAHSYHLNRVIEWLGNQNINHFPTRHNQQLYHNVFAEYIVTHTFLLSESDTFAGMVQFFASLGSIVACSLVTQRMGGAVRVQILSSVMLATLPIAILESTPVQVDYVASFFFISFLYFGYEALDSPKRDTIVAMALSLALGAFSKYTILMFSLPFCLYFGSRFFLKRGLLGSMKILALFITALFIVFLPFMSRNYVFFGNILSPVEGSGLEAESLSVSQISVKETISGMIKNIGLHIGLPSNGYNLFMEGIVEKLHQILNINLNPAGMDIFSVRFVLHEDMAPNTVHMAMLGISLIGLVFIKGKVRVKWFAFCAIMGLAVFSTLMVFQLWSSRTHLPFFVVGCITSAIVLDHYLKKKTAYIALILIISSIPFVLANPSKPLLPLRYYSKKLLNYAPNPFCPQNSEQVLAVKTKLSRYYFTTPNKSDCFVLKQNISKEDQAKIFGTLDALNYFNEEKYESVFALDKVQLYFLNHPNNYDKFKGLLSHMEGLNENIGVLFREGNGYYHYWASIQGEKYNFGQMRYIGYRPKYATLENANQRFEYQFIFGDDSKLLTPYYKQNVVDTVYYSKGFYFAKLKKKVEYRVSL